jgi:anti-sigma28 factor (negative regulator of flagellin synthesis)
MTDLDKGESGEPVSVERRELCEKVKAVPEVRSRAVFALRQAVLAGSYRVGNEDIAEAMFRELRQQKRGQLW